jgi:hypothetical protein
VPRRLCRALVMTVALSVLASLPAGAASSFGFLFRTDLVRSDSQFFGNLAVTNLGYSRVVVEPLLPRIAYVETDLPTILFLAHESGRSPRFIVDLRSRGLSWIEISHRVGFPVGVLFAGFESDPGPPYGKAWGYWKKQGRALHLGDRDFTNLVQIQLGSHWAGVGPNVLVRAQRQGRSVPAFVAERKGRPYKVSAASYGRGGHAKARPAKAELAKGKPAKSGKAAGKAKGQGHGKH